MDKDKQKKRADLQKKIEENFWDVHLYEKSRFSLIFDLSTSNRQEKLEEFERQEKLERLERLEKLVELVEATEFFGGLTLPFIDMNINDTIHYSRRNVIKHVFGNKKMYPILKMPDYVKSFFEISNLLKIGFPNVPKPPKTSQEPKKPQEPIYNSNVENISEGKYIIENRVTFLRILGAILMGSLHFCGVFLVVFFILLPIFGLMGILAETGFSSLSIICAIISIFYMIYKGSSENVKMSFTEKKKKFIKYTEEEKEEIKNDLIRKNKIEHQQKLEQYKKHMEEYEINIKKIKEEKRNYPMLFDKWVQDMNKNYLGWLDKEFLDTIKMNKSFNFQRVKNPREGSSEGRFFNQLYQKFKNEIKIDTALEYYYPDVAMVINNSIIDIEIDEPYTSDERKEIHYIDDKGIHIDTKRDNFFLDKNWFVLRFSEDQIVQHADICVELISLVSEFIKTAKVSYLYNYIKLSENIQQEQWTYEDARYMANMNSRKGQLKIR